MVHNILIIRIFDFIRHTNVFKMRRYIFLHFIFSPVVARDILVQELTDEIREKNSVIDGLNAQVLETKLNKPRQGLVKMNDDIIKKNTILKDKVKSHNETIENLKIKIKEQKNLIMVKNVEISNNKMIVSKYNKLLRKFGSSVQQKVDGSTKEEILSNLDVDVTSNYHYFVAKGFSEIEIMNYMAVRVPPYNSSFRLT